MELIKLLDWNFLLFTLLVAINNKMLLTTYKHIVMRDKVIDLYLIFLNNVAHVHDTEFN